MRIAIGWRQLVALGLERVADQPVDDRDAGRAARRLGQELRVPAADRRLERAPAEARGLAEPAVDGAGDRVVHELDRARRGPDAVERPLGDREMERLQPLRRGRELLDAQPDECLCLGHARETTRAGR